VSTSERRTSETGRLTVESRYDLLLAVLPLPLLLGAVGGVATSLPVSVGVGLGGLPAALILAYGLFVDAPTPGRRSAGRRRD
jgi:hypothetical protein